MDCEGLSKDIEENDEDREKELKDKGLKPVVSSKKSIKVDTIQTSGIQLSI
jgi:hypothetical protein